jgi:hypothetical protein
MIETWLEEADAPTGTSASASAASVVVNPHLVCASPLIDSLPGTSSTADPAPGCGALGGESNQAGYST